jgi:SRSO17 transposase
LRLWLEDQHRHYVLAIPQTHVVWVAGRHQPIGYLAALLPESAWTVLSAGEGSQGPRLYEWAWRQLSERDEPLEHAQESRPEPTRFLLIRRSLSDPSNRAYYRVAGPARLTLPEVVQIAGRRWTIEEAIEEARMRGGPGSV